MAGIGFTLKRVITKGGLSSFAVGSLSGVFIVAGPSLMAMASLWLITGPLAAVGEANMGQFTALLVYTFAATIILSGGLQYSFTRYVADAIHRGDERVAVGALLRLLAGLVPSAFALAASAAYALPVLPGVSLPAAMALCGWLAASVTAMWVLVLFSSMLRAYGRILGLYAASMALAVLAAWALKGAGSPGLVAAFSLAYTALDLGLLVLIVLEHRPLRPPRGSAVLAMARRYPALFWYGIAYYAAGWVDKAVYWIAEGVAMEGTALRLYPPMDSVAYFAGLSMVPGLVFFIVSSETDYFAALRRFLTALSGKPYRKIRQCLEELNRKARLSLSRLGIFQAGLSLAAILVAPLLVAHPAVQRIPFALYVAGAVFHLVALAAQNFLFYIEAYVPALGGALAFLGGSLAASIASALLVPGGPPGLGYLAGAALSALVSVRSLYASLRSLDRVLYTKVS